MTHKESPRRAETGNAGSTMTRLKPTGTGSTSQARSANRKLERTTLRTSRLLDFCSRKELIAQIGHELASWPLVVAKELLDNALDACEEADTAPEIAITVNVEGITVKDNGPGIPVETIDGVLDFAVRVSNREAYVALDRGAQGNALKTLIAMPFVLDGDEGHVEITTRGERHGIGLRVDSIRQEPVIDHIHEPAPDVKTGATVAVAWPDSACSILTDAEERFLQIADDYTWLNPHLSLTVDCFGKRTRIEATDPSWSKWRPCDPTSAHWYQNQHFDRLVAGYIAHDADRGRDRTVRELVAEFRGFTGSAKQKFVLDATGLARTNLSALANSNGIRSDLTKPLLAAMQAHSKPVKPIRVGIIGKEHLRKRFEAIGCDLDSFTYKKVAEIEDDVPSLAEFAFGYIPRENLRRRLVCGVNWSPGIVNPFRQLGRFGQSCDTALANLRVRADDPVILVLHLACPRVEYTDRGESAVVMGA